jgi:exodeoxyribonuclease-5
MTARIREAIDGADVPRFETQKHPAGSLILLEPADFETALLSSFRSSHYQSDPDHCRVLAWTNQRTSAYNRIIRRSLLGPNADQQSLLPGEIVVACTPILGRVNVGDFVTVLEAVPVQHHGIPAYRAIILTEKGKPLEVFVVRPEGYPAFKLRLSDLVKTAQALQKRLGSLTHQEDQQRREAWVEFFEFKDEAFCDLRPIHSSTVHKSQGSTYETVYVDLSDIGRNTRRDVLLRLLYVALTRARGDVVVTGELPARLYLDTSATCGDSVEYA